MKVTLASTHPALGAVTVLPPDAASGGPVAAGISVERVENLPENFIVGADVSSVLSLEESGVVFRDAAGQPADLFVVLKDHGFTDIRVRVWNDPFDEYGNGYGGGNVNAERATIIGKRATAAGLNVLVNFHYSDFWADPGKQIAPKAWAGLSIDEVTGAVFEFTRDTLTLMRDQGVAVTMVQVGNETNTGVAGFTDWPGMCAIFNAGAAAVREVLPRAQVAVHFANPEVEGSYAHIARTLHEHSVDYDVFASSYYPFWHGTTENLTALLKDIAETYGKQVIVVETSWVSTLDDADGYPNMVKDASEVATFAPSVQGQADALRAVIQAVANVGASGLGVHYWEPAWLPVGPPSEAERSAELWERFGSGAGTTASALYLTGKPGAPVGNEWDNQILFAPDGTPLESLRVFQYARTGAIAST